MDEIIEEKINRLSERVDKLEKKVKEIESGINLIMLHQFLEHKVIEEIIQKKRR